MEFGVNIHEPQRMKPIDFGHPLTFYLVPSASQKFHLSSETSQYSDI